MMARNASEALIWPCSLHSVCYWSHFNTSDTSVPCATSCSAMRNTHTSSLITPITRRMHGRVNRDPPSGRRAQPQHITERATTCANVQCQGAASGTTLLATNQPYKLHSSRRGSRGKPRTLHRAALQRSAQRLWRHADADREPTTSKSRASKRIACESN